MYIRKDGIAKATDRPRDSEPRTREGRRNPPVVKNIARRSPPSSVVFFSEGSSESPSGGPIGKEK